MKILFLQVIPFRLNDFQIKNVESIWDHEILLIANFKFSTHARTFEHKCRHVVIGEKRNEKDPPELFEKNR
jgi:hypothetical protein